MIVTTNQHKSKCRRQFEKNRTYFRITMALSLARHKADCGWEGVPQEMLLLQEMFRPTGKGKEGVQ